MNFWNAKERMNNVEKDMEDIGEEVNPNVLLDKVLQLAGAVRVSRTYAKKRKYEIICDVKEKDLDATNVVLNVNQLIKRIKAIWPSSVNSVDCVRIFKKMVENPKKMTKLVAYKEKSQQLWKKLLKEENETSDELSNCPSELAMLNNVNDVVCSILSLEGIGEGSKFEKLKKLFGNKKSCCNI